MNIFEYHLSEIKKIVISKGDFLKLDQIDNLKGVNLEVPPDHFNFDLSCNIAMVLGKKNDINPKTLALKLKEIFLDEISNFSEIDIAGPGFLNIKLSKSALIKNINSILNNKNTYGSIKNSENYNIEFGGNYAVEILYFIARISKPKNILETGVAAGYSSYTFLKAIKKNKVGTLYSSDFPYFRLKNPRNI